MATTTPTTSEIDLPGRAAPDDARIQEEMARFAGRRVAVAMSGGVDSAVAALRLVQAGADVVGLSLRLHDPDPDNPMAPRACCPPEDLQDARRVAEALDVPFYVVDARSAFEDRVVRPFVRDYVAGRTPNPCVGCNSFVKLGRLVTRARALGCETLATGHFARLAPADGGAHLFRGVDRDKDQSYFLFAVAAELLAFLTFPLGAWDKAQVRDAALGAGLPVAHKLESQEVCFVGGKGAGKFVRGQPEAAAVQGGDLVSEAGEVLGRHEGIMGFTVGQRRGIGVAAKHPLFVLGIDAPSRQVTVGPAEALERRGLIAERTSWPAGPPEGPFEAKVRIRYRDPGATGRVSWGSAGEVRVDFAAPVRAIAPGQAVVFERGDEVVGGAWIRESVR